MTKYKSLLLAILLIVFAGCEKEKEGKIEFDPEAVTQEVESLEMFSATIYGKLVLPDIRKEDFTFGFEYSTDQAFSALKLKRVECAFYNTQNGNMFSSSLTNLTMGTAYYYRAYITYKGVTYYGDVMTFTTKGVEVTTGDMDPSTFEVTSKVAMGSDFEKIRYGLCFGETENLSVESSVIGTNEAEQDGSYTLRLNDIPYGEFFYRAYVTVNGVTYYGEVKKLEGNKVITGELNPESMTVSGWVRYYTGYDDFSYGICYGKNSVPTKENDRSVAGGRFDEDNNFKATMVRIPSGKVYYRAYIVIGQKVYYGETFSFEHKMSIGEPVDLGLSVKWAGMNVGAVNDSDYGYYFSWGETEDKVGVSSHRNYRYCGNESSARLERKLIKYNNNPYYGDIDALTVLEPMDDAATVLWGSDWRTPTQAEFKELLDNCSWNWTPRNGVNGYEVTSNITGNTIFMPAGGGYSYEETINIGMVGIYWTRNLYENNATYAYCLFFNDDEPRLTNDERYYSFSIRAIYVK